MTMTSDEVKLLDYNRQTYHFFKMMTEIHIRLSRIKNGVTFTQML